MAADELNPWEALNDRYGRDENAQFLLFVEQLAEIRPLLLADLVSKRRLALVAIDNLAEVVLVRHLQSIDDLVANDRRALAPRLTDKQRQKFHREFSYRAAIGQKGLAEGRSGSPLGAVLDTLDASIFLSGHAYRNRVYHADHHNVRRRSLGAGAGGVSMIFVIGATGKVGRHVVSGLLDTGAVVRALARDPDTAGLPQRVEVVRGDLSDLAGLEERLDGAEAVFLVWPFFSDEGAGDVVKAIARHTGRIVYLSAQAAEEQPDSFWAKVERFIEHSGVEWTFLRPTGFAANTRMWADQIRETGVVRWPYGHAARSLIDERDIAAVAVHALT